MKMDLVVQIKFGSHLYGTNTPESDTDFKSVYVPSARDILLQRVVGSLAKPELLEPGVDIAVTDSYGKIRRRGGSAE